jgi:hypothetical protein
VPDAALGRPAPVNPAAANYSLPGAMPLPADPSARGFLRSTLPSLNPLLMQSTPAPGWEPLQIHRQGIG